MSNKIIVYSDGGVIGNGTKDSIGGWGAVLTYKDNIKEICGGERGATNNTMELTACIEALSAIDNKEIPIEIYVDSAYVCNGMNDWHYKWEKNGWKTAGKKPVENQELWQKLIKLSRSYKDVKFLKTKAHSGIELNELADQLATKGMEEVRCLSK